MSTRDLFVDESAEALSRTTFPEEPEVIHASDLDGLPPPVRRYLLRSGVVGQERVRSFHARLRGRIKTSEGGRWLPFDVDQYSALGNDLARLFYLRARLFGFVPVVGRDKYAGRQGEMLIRPLDLFTASRVTGPAMDHAALVTLLNDLFMAPTAMLDERIVWEAIDSTAARATITDGPLSVSGAFVFDEHDDLVNFYTDDRTYDDGRGTTRKARWWTPFERHGKVGRLRVPTYGHATWDFGERTYTYAEMELVDIDYNVRQLSVVGRRGR